MKRFFKFLIWSILALVVLAGVLLAGFVYKIKNGFPVSFETEVPEINIPDDKTTVLLFSKTTGFRHDESIATSKMVFDQLAEKNKWFLYSTEEGGVFNPQQLTKFDVVIFNNSTGRVLNDAQQMALENYVEQGGTLIGIHGAGDDSHHWEWYEKNLTGTKFSHHPIENQLQEAHVLLNEVSDSVLASGLPSTWEHTDEWYVFFENPGHNGFDILFTIDGEKINPSGNLLMIQNKNFGMGKHHPVAWYKVTGKGKTFYTSIGHDALAWKQQPFITMIENVIFWSAAKPQ